MNQPKKNWYTRGGKAYNSRGKPPWMRKDNAKSNSPITSGVPKEVSNKEIKPTPYKAWYQYFPEEDYIEGSPVHKKIKAFENFIQSNITSFSFDKIEDCKFFTVDLVAINKDETLRNEWQDFAEDLCSNGEVTLNCLGLAMHQTVINDIENQSVRQGHDFELERLELPIIRARIANHQPILHLKNLKVNYFGKLVSVRGTVIRVGNVKLISRFMAFQCGGCGGSQIIRQPDGIYTMPTKCATKGCRSQSKFIPLLLRTHTRTESWQVLKLQELVGTDQCEGGRIPRTVECELTDDLVDSCVPGDDVTITGIIKVRNSEEGNNRSKQASIFSLYLDVVSVTNNKNQSQTANGAQGIEFNLVDYYAIQALLEAMEQQSVSIAKAGVVSTLPARTTILAAANPTGGHYNRAKTVSENLKIGAALLSRFDLVFILTDNPNQYLDTLLSEHVLALHVGGNKTRLDSNTADSQSLNTSTAVTSTLQQRLRLVQDEYLDVLPHQLLRKYIAYARKYVHPFLSVEAAAVLKQFYYELRKKHQTADYTPVTTRQTSSLARLTLARAKIEMREIATREDALEVVELMKYSLVDTFSDDHNVLDFTRSQHGSGMSQRNKVKKFVGLLQRKAENESNNEFTITELKEIAQKHGLDDFYRLLNSLNTHGYLLKKSSSTYRLLSVDI